MNTTEKPMAETHSPLVWIDMEMSGLDPEKNVILEIATIVTNEALEVIAEGPDIVLSHSLDLLKGMDDWNREHHRKSGLWDAVLTSTTSLAEASQKTLEFIQQHTQPRKSPLCGNSIWQDRRFISRYMRDLDHYLHYRMIDVSTIKELARRWHPSVHDKKAKKTGNHRALDDIRESIEELRYYKEHLFVRL
jgi:oligoribonuclease